MWIVCITSVRHVLTVNGYGGRQTKENEKSWCFKGWETLVNILSHDANQKYHLRNFIFDFIMIVVLFYTPFYYLVYMNDICPSVIISRIK